MAERWIDGRKEIGFYVTTRETSDRVYLIYAENEQHALRAFVETGAGDVVASDLRESVRLTDPNPIPPWSPEAHRADPEAAEADEAWEAPPLLPKPLATALKMLREARAIDLKLHSDEEAPTGDHYNEVAAYVCFALSELEEVAQSHARLVRDEEQAHAELRRLDRENVKLARALQWLLDEMHDADETHHPSVDPNAPDAPIYDSVENAAAALIENHGSLYWYSAERAAAFRAKQRAEDGAEGGADA